MTSLLLQQVCKYFIRIGDCLSQLLNVVVFFGQNPNESLSGRAYKMHKTSWAWNILYTVINLLFILQKNHCRESYGADLVRARDLLENRHG
jgi:hypothetical protein